MESLFDKVGEELGFVGEEEAVYFEDGVAHTEVNVSTREKVHVVLNKLANGNSSRGRHRKGENENTG
jgi:hypothetical protein